MITEDSASCRQNRRHSRETRESYNRSTLACNSNLTERADQQGTNQTVSPSKQAERAAPSIWPRSLRGNVYSFHCILLWQYCIPILSAGNKKKKQQTNITFKKGRQHSIPQDRDPVDPHIYIAEQHDMDEFTARDTPTSLCVTKWSTYKWIWLTGDYCGQWLSSMTRHFPRKLEEVMSNSKNNTAIVFLRALNLKKSLDGIHFKGLSHSLLIENPACPISRQIWCCSWLQSYSFGMSTLASTSMYCEVYMQIYEIIHIWTAVVDEREEWLSQ